MSAGLGVLETPSAAGDAVHSTPKWNGFSNNPFHSRWTAAHPPPFNSTLIGRGRTSV